MKISSSLSLLTITAVLTLNACSHSEKQEKSASSMPAPAVQQTESAFLKLNQLDTRKPVPLQPMMAWHQKQNMMKHLVVIQRVTQGLTTEDWQEIAEASALIESSPKMQQMCEHMGSGADGFTELALEFHHRADAIGEAARAQDGAAVLAATANTLQACTTCHATFRQEVMNAAAWQERTGSTHQPMSHQ